MKRNNKVGTIIGFIVIMLMVGPAVKFTLGSMVLSVPFEAKIWGVALMGVATLIFFLLPWLDQSPVKSIRYKGTLCRAALGIFVVVFLVLGYYGTQPVTTGGTLISQVCTLIYFAYFLLMPWYTRMDKTLPEPTRVTW